LRLFAEVLEEGSYLEAIIDHAGPTPIGPRPDLRRILRPIGPVAVFGASNFPFAFSVPGGDTASALAAGCAVIAKAHPLHPATSLLAQEALLSGARAAGLAATPVGLVFGQEAGGALVMHPAIQAVGFTGSLEVGRLLADAAASRPAPIPFYGELGALNAVVVCASAAAARHEEVAAGLVASFTLGVGQFCTKPGIVLLPAGRAGAALLDDLGAAARSVPSAVMLGEGIAQRFRARSGEIAQAPGIRVRARGEESQQDTGSSGLPLLVEAEGIEAITGLLLEECFGPLLVAVTYGDRDELVAILDRLGPALTATVHADPADHDGASSLLDLLAAKVGRVIWNGYPTGVAVTWAMQHGGPYPATTNPLHTSVGMTSIRRWLRPVAYQGVPEALLPAELRDAPEPQSVVPRRVDGKLELPAEEP
jgi:NADP-dependent aldehyde dehydrogenase